MIVVSDTSPLVNLAAIGKLDLLHQLYGKILVPDAVYRETVHVGAGEPGAYEVAIFEWIERQVVTNRAVVTALELELDSGEAEAIALALEVGADLVLIDERKGRFVAGRMGVQFVGLLGILIEAKQRGLLPAVRPVLDDLKQNAGFWIRDQLYQHILQLTGE